MAEYRLKFIGNGEFLVISPELLSLLLSRIGRSKEKEVLVDMEKWMPKEYQDYVLNVININRKINGFSFEWILPETLTQTELFQIVEKQLRDLQLDEKNCFERVQLLEKRGNVIELNCNRPFWLVCKNTEAVFLYEKESGETEKIVIKV